MVVIVDRQSEDEGDTEKEKQSDKEKPSGEETPQIEDQASGSRYRKLWNDENLWIGKKPRQEEDSLLDYDIKNTANMDYDIRRHLYADQGFSPVINGLRGAPLKIESAFLALDLLATGVRVQDVPLVENCIESLDRLLEKNNLLTILACLTTIIEYSKGNDFLPSAPPLVEKAGQLDRNWSDELIQKLRTNVLLEIDKKANYVLKQKELSNLSYDDLLEIVERDTLLVTDEILVYLAVYRWGIAECQRQRLNTYTLNLKTVLKDLPYAPRYGFISRNKFVKRAINGIEGPTSSGLLNEEDWRLVKFFIEERKKGRPVKKLPHKWSQPRLIGMQKPRVLSSRSSALASAPTSFSNRDRLSASQQKSCFEKCIIVFLTCWSAVFD